MKILHPLNRNIRDAPDNRSIKDAYESRSNQHNTRLSNEKIQKSEIL